MKEPTTSYREILTQPFDRYDVIGFVLAIVIMSGLVKLLSIFIGVESATKMQVAGVQIVATILGFVIWKATRFYASFYTP